ncbi:U-box domain-containing protein 52-like [Salvia splendens]|uniref:U-box domain-containing protein 52-like n=1 Tax=Salvia splendens TaxID=180675 RepID=UPI001C2625B0|nr:U-box domain-containing protein 52-like [Salvia splendens]
MWLQNGKTPSSSPRKKGSRNGLVAVAIDKDKSSMYAMRWAAENLLSKGQTVILIHVLQKPSSNSGHNYALNGLNGSGNDIVLEKPTKDLFITFHCLCTRKNIACFDVVLEDMDIAKAITEYTAHAAIENLILGASRHGFIRRLKTVDVPTSVSKASPEFCTVYVISKSKISSLRNASRQAPFASPLLTHLQPPQERSSNPVVPLDSQHLPSKVPDRILRRVAPEETDMMSKSPILSRGYNPNMFMDLSESDTDISFISSDRASTESRFMDPLLCDGVDSGGSSRVSVSSESSFGLRPLSRFSDVNSMTEYSTGSMESDEMETEMRRLKLELQKTMDMYSTACKEAITAKQKAVELHQWRVDEEKRIEDARMVEEATRATTEAANRVLELESQKRVEAERKMIMQDNGDDNGLIVTPLRYRKYSIEEIELATEYFHESRKIGEGGYGPVYKCSLDHTLVAVKVLRPDAAQGRSQFQQEVEVLSCLRHPNMVLLLGACPEYGCLVYEYMANGSLEDRLLRKGNTRPLTWQLRYRIAAEIATGLHFLHQTKPEPLVHRDLKPGNILLDQNYVSKIGDVGLARLVPPSVADDVTQYRMTSTAGTFCYIDPEYQQTGMLGVKSDVYSLGVVLLQIITARPAMGLAHHIGNAIEKGALVEMLDPTVPDWPMEETMNYAKLAIQCAELRRKDRPDLGKVVVPELNKLRVLGEENMSSFVIGGNSASTPNHSFIFRSSNLTQDFKSDPNVQSTYSGIEGSHFASASMPGN